VWNLNEVWQNKGYDPVEVIESPLRFATTSISVFGDGKGFAIGSIEGRVGV
jgi:hypothetical protein